jgi:hypothetical protein
MCHFVIDIVPLVGNLNAQFGSRWYESNSGHNEHSFQHEQQTVHDRFLVSAANESDQCVQSTAEQSENERSQITHNHERCDERSIPDEANPWTSKRFTMR